MVLSLGDATQRRIDGRGKPATLSNRRPKLLTWARQIVGPATTARRSAARVWGGVVLYRKQYRNPKPVLELERYRVAGTGSSPFHDPSLEARSSIAQHAAAFRPKGQQFAQPGPFGPGTRSTPECLRPNGPTVQNRHGTAGPLGLRMWVCPVFPGPKGPGWANCWPLGPKEQDPLPSMETWVMTNAPTGRGVFAKPRNRSFRGFRTSQSCKRISDQGGQEPADAISGNGSSEGS